MQFSFPRSDLTTNQDGLLESETSRLQSNPAPTLYLDPPMGLDSAPTGRTIDFAYQAGQLAIYPRKKGAERAACSSPSSPSAQEVDDEERAIYFFEPTQLSPYMHPLIAEGSAIFRQSLKLEGTSSSLFTTGARYLEKNIQGLADKYSKAIGRHINFLLNEQEEALRMEGEGMEHDEDEEVETDDGDFTQASLDDLKNQLNIARGRKIIWGFATALYLIPPSKPIGPGLVQWQIDNYPGVIRRVIDQSSQIASSVDWKVYERMALLCLLPELTKALRRHQHEGPEGTAIKTLLALLESRPVMESSYSYDVFSEKRRAWIKEIIEEKGRLRAMDFTLPCRLLDILSGDTRVIIDMAMHWNEAYVALAYHMDPLADALSLRTQGRRCMETFGLTGKATTLEEAEDEQEQESETFLDCISALIEGRFILAMESCKIMDGWMGAHLADLFARRGYLEDPRLRRDPKSKDTSLRQYFILEYAIELWNTSDSWEVSGLYFTECGTTGRAHLQELITRVPIRSEAHLILVLNFCVKHDLRHQYREILRVWGMRLFRQGKPVPAIDRLAQAGCGDIVNEVIQDVFNRCIQQVEPMEGKDLATSTKEIPVHLHLHDEGIKKRRGLEKRFPAFRTLLDYQRFQKLMSSSGVDEEGARLLLDLLTSPHTPSLAIRRLYKQLVAFLEKDHSNGVYFDLDQTFHLLEHLEEASESSDGLDLDWNAEDLIVARSALTRYLSTIMQILPEGHSYSC
ncbi:MAG: Nup85 nucleoporin-domain-containing protein [Piptocephalis tieghemiana]|nr:MAG: Nup85 nucleoporin-domain-containing protein [Piptocephalis tieghemiana]